MFLQSKKWTAGFLLLSSLMLPMATMAQDDGKNDSDTKADGRGNITRTAQPRGVAGITPTGYGINYHGGPVMNAGINVYYIWYGNWAQDTNANPILTDFAKSIGGSPYFNINTTYSDTTAAVKNSVTYVKAVSDTGSLGTSLSDANILSIVTNQINSGALPNDPKGIYFVLTAPYVAETSGFLSSYCGWHDQASLGGNTIKYSFVGHPAANMSACTIQSTSPNGDAAADGMASVLAHELEEAATDPQLSAWYDSAGNENGDKCAWNFGTTSTLASGAKYNMTLGSRNFLIQQNWLNTAPSGGCALSYVATPDFSLSVSPASQTIAAGGTTGNYTLTATALNGWTGTVTYSVSGLPSAATAHVTGNTITVSTTTSIAAGTHSFTISGTDGTHTHTTSASFVVSAPSFSLSISPATASVTRPSTGSVTATYKVTVTPIGAFTGTVNLTASGGSTGLTLSLSPTSVANANGTSTLTATVTSSARRTTRTLTVTGTSGSTSKTATATLTIN